jgi:general secretion pathway protein G
MQQIFPSDSRRLRGLFETRPDCQRGRRSIRAMTIIELLLGIAIAATLGTIGVPMYTNYIDRARITEAITGIRAIEMEVTKYQAERGKLPDTLDQVGLAGRLDPWGRRYEYLRIEGLEKKDVQGKWRKDRFLVPVNSDYDVYSMGKDGESHPAFTTKASRDDIVRANNGAYVGLASDY